jgi:hypothetical protein
MGWRQAGTDLVIDGAKFVGEQVFHLFRGGDAVTPTLTKRETIAATGSQASADVYARQHGDGSVVKMSVNAKNPVVFEQQHTTIDVLEDQYGLDADDVATLRLRHGDGQIDLRDLSEDDVFIGALKVQGVDLLMHPQPSNNPKMQDPAVESAGSDGEVTYQIFDHNQIDNVVRISPFHIDGLGFYSPARRAIEGMDKPAATVKEFLNRLDTTNSNTAKGVGHDAEDMGIIDLLRKEPDQNAVITRDDVLMMMDSMRLPVKEVNVGGPGAVEGGGGNYDEAFDDAFIEFQRDHLDVTELNLNSTAGREEVNWQRDLLDDDQRSFMDEFMEYVRENMVDDLDPSELGQGIDEETAVRLYWDDWAGARAEWLVENSGNVTAAWAPDGGRHTYSINGNTEDGYYTATVRGFSGPQAGQNETREFRNTDDAQQWLFEQARDNDDVRIDSDEGDTRWSEFTTEGIKEYQEVRLMLPEHPMDSGRQNYYNRAHYPEANILVSTRFGYWTTNFGEDYGSRTLHVDEIQGDLHQQGEEFGYRTKDGVYIPGFNKAGTAAASDRIVPDAPFKKNWYQLGFKRLLTEAVRQDADRISWTTGAAQLARYPGTARHLTSLQVTRNVFPGRQPGDDAPTYEVIAVDVNGATVHELHVAEHNLHDLMGKQLADEVAAKSGTWDVGESQSYTELGGMQVGGKGLTNLYDEKLPRYVRTLFKKYGVKPKLSGNPYRVVERTSTEREPMPIVDGKPTGLGREIKTTVFEVYSGEGEDQKFHGMFFNKNMAEQSIRENDQRVWYIDITPEMREHILKEGLPLTFKEHKTSGRYV